MRRKTEGGRGETAKRGNGKERKHEETKITETKKGEGNVADALAPFSLFPSSPSSPSPPARLSRRPSVAIIGAGRLGTALARALAACGYDVAAVVARRLSHARRAAAATGTPPPHAFDASQLHLLPVTGILFITTPDDRIAEVAARLAASTNLRAAAKPEDPAKPDAVRRAPPRGRRIVALHASGALSSDALAPLAACGFAVGSMHPLVAVSDSRGGAESLRGAFYCLEGERAAVGAARSLVRALGGNSFSVNTADKSLYHAAAVMGSGHAVALFDIASELLARCGLSPTEARRVLMPLVRSTLENLSTQTPPRALTGSFARADTATVFKHLVALQHPATREALAAYLLLGKRSLQLAARNGADAEALAEIARELEKTVRGEQQRDFRRLVD